MVIARSIKEVFDFITAADLEGPESSRTKFHLRILSNLVMVRITELLGDNTALFELALRAGLEGWTNMATADGQAVIATHDEGTHMVQGVMVTRPLSLESLDTIDTATVGEIVSEIMRRNSLTDDDVKN